MTALFLDTRYESWAMGVIALAVVLALITFRGRRLSGWVAALAAWLWRRRRAAESPSEPVVGATVMPGDHVAVRWQGEFLCALIELTPRPFSPTIVVDGRARTDDVIDSELLQRLLSIHCPDLEADIVSAGYRVGGTATAEIVTRYEQAIGSDPAPAHRRTWIMLRAYPMRTRRSTSRRDDGVAGLIRYLVASMTRIALDLASSGLDASCERSFDDFDHATDIRFVREGWSRIKGDNAFTAAYTTPGGPDAWWSANAEHTVTRFRISPGKAPRSTVLLTTAAKVKPPKGFSTVSGGQRAALQGQDLVLDQHHLLPIGSAGVLMGQTPDGHSLYLPFDDVDVCVDFDAPRSAARFATRAAAAGGLVTLAEELGELAAVIGAHPGPESKVVWSHGTTFFGPRPGVDPVILRDNVITTPQHREFMLRQPHHAGKKLQNTALPG